MELALLGLAGYALIARKIVSEEGLETLSRLVVGLFLPLFMFTEIISRFNLRDFPYWWIFPLLSLLLTAAGYALGLIVLRFDRSLKGQEGSFLGISTFQNSGYLPLPLVAGMLPPDLASDMFIYIFLFLLGFNMTIFSFGVVILSRGCSDASKRNVCYKDMFNAPVIATIAALVVVFLRLQDFIPPVLMRPGQMLGRCAIPLSIFVVGGNLALIRIHSLKNIRPLAIGLAIKLLILPLAMLFLLFVFKPRPLVGLLLIIQACMPPAAFLSVIARNEKLEEELVNQAILYGHILAILTIPLFLGLYRAF